MEQKGADCEYNQAIANLHQNCQTTSNMSYCPYMTNFVIGFLLLRFIPKNIMDRQTCKNKDEHQDKIYK